MLRNPAPAAPALWTRRTLIRQLVEREIVGRYRGSWLGMLWSLLNPLIMLAIYTFVFSVVFRAHWAHEGTTTGQFAILLFAGLITFSFFAEAVNRAPMLILGNATYVKKVVFPLEILPVVAVGAGLVHAAISVAVLLAFILGVTGSVPVTALWLPLVLLPLAILTLGLSWFLASLGVYLRDIPQILGPVVTALMFLSPIFYPISALPDWIRPYLFLNPLALPIEQVRDVLIWGEAPDFLALGLYSIPALAVAALGYVFFQRTRKGFADVL